MKFNTHLLLSQLVAKLERFIALCTDYGTDKTAPLLIVAS